MASLKGHNLKIIVMSNRDSESCISYELVNVTNVKHKFLLIIYLFFAIYLYNFIKVNLREYFWYYQLVVLIDKYIFQGVLETKHGKQLKFGSQFSKVYTFRSTYQLLEELS